MDPAPRQTCPPRNAAATGNNATAGNHASRSRQRTDWTSQTPLAVRLIPSHTVLACPRIPTRNPTSAFLSSQSDKSYSAPPDANPWSPSIDFRAPRRARANHSPPPRPLARSSPPALLASSYPRASRSPAPATSPRVAGPRRTTRLPRVHP